jgi:tetratricopeptide (TPR) repeat protein
MKARIHILYAAAALALLTAGCAQFQHVPAGQSVLQAQAKKAELIALPPSPPVIDPNTGLAQVKPDLPSGKPQPPSSGVDYFALGNLYFQDGKTTDAITAFKKATELDPSYAEAWHNLALCYENAGDEQDAMAAYRKYKSFPQQ